MRQSLWIAVGTLALAACSGGGETGNVASTIPEAPPTGVTRDAVATPTPSPTPMPAAAAIQTQPGPKGNTVALTKAQVTGDILTVALTFTGTGDCCVHMPIEDVSVIDDKTSQRISVLKDNAGKWMASPVGSDGKSIDLSDFKGVSQVWFKFPAPPATSPTISVAVPGAAPFDAVPVTR